MKHLLASTIAVVVACLGAAGSAAAQEHDEPHRSEPAPVRGPMQLDQRYHHDHYYPARGQVVRVLPSGSARIGYGGGSWFFHAGVWY